MFTDFPLHKQILKALDKQGLEQPTPVQAKTIPLALEGKDLLVSAETGSGKTFAFLLPILQKLMETDAPLAGTRALILVPTRELARQVFKNCKDLVGYTKLQTGIIIGGDEFKYQKALLRKNPEIVIATPGRIAELLSHNAADFSDLEILVLDEADRMLDMGLSDDVLQIADSCKLERQTLLFSATLGHRGVLKVAEKVLSEPQTLTLSTAQDQHTNITQQSVLVDDRQHKERVLTWLLANDPYQKALIFTNTKVHADQLCGLLKYHNLAVGVLHGDMDQDQRNKVMTEMRHGRINVLVATDVAARGLDIKGIDLVVNFDLPRNGDDYIHRIGRTGRAGEKGTAITFVAGPDWNNMASIEKYLRLRFEQRTIKSLEGKFKGPKKLKASGKVAGKKKKDDDKGDKKKDTGVKVKQRLRDKKNIGKRRAPSAHKPEETSETSSATKSTTKPTAKPATKARTWGTGDNVGDGWAPIKKKKD